MGGERPELLTVSPWLLPSQAGSPGSLHPIPLSLVTCWELGAAPAPSEPQLPSSSPRSSFFQKDGEIQGCRATGPWSSGGSSLELSLLLPSPSVPGLCSPKPAWSLVGPPAALHAACGEGWCSGSMPGAWGWVSLQGPFLPSVHLGGSSSGYRPFKAPPPGFWSGSSRGSQACGGGSVPAAELRHGCCWVAARAAGALAGLPWKHWGSSE